MSFFSPPAGMVATAGYAEADQDFQDTAAQGFTECLINPRDPGEGTTICGLTTGYLSGTEFDVAALMATAKATALAAGDRPDYYVLMIAAQSNGIGPGTTGCDDIDGGCGPDDDGAVTNHMSVTGGTGDWVLPGVSPLLTEIEGSDSGDGIQTLAGHVVRFGDTSPFNPVYLVNPAPPLPVPDGAGNEFTEVLFTEDQVPSNVSVSLASSGAHGPLVSCEMHCVAMRDTRVTHGPTETPWMCVL